MTDPRELVERASEVGLDAVVITEHDYQWKADELAELATYARRFRVGVFSGVEVSAREGHFLVYGLPSLKDVEPGITLRKLLRVVREHDAAIVAAHPFRWDQDFREIVEEHGPAFDALEFVSKNVSPETRKKTESLLSRHTMGRTGSSDSHEVDTIGCYYSEIPGPINTLAEFVGAIRTGRTRPRHNPMCWLASGPVD